YPEAERSQHLRGITTRKWGNKRWWPESKAKAAKAAIKAAKNGQYLVNGELGISISRSGHEKKTVERWERLGLIEPAVRVGPRLKIHDESALRAAKRARSAKFDGVYDKRSADPLYNLAAAGRYLRVSSNQVRVWLRTGGRPYAEFFSR